MRALSLTCFKTDSTGMTVRSKKSMSITGSIRMIHDPRSLSHLWQAVLLAQMEDAFSRNEITVARVRAWLRSEDYVYVCDLGEIRKDWATRVFNLIMRSPDKTARYYYDSAKKFIMLLQKQ